MQNSNAKLNTVKCFFCTLPFLYCYLYCILGIVTAHKIEFAHASLAAFTAYEIEFARAYFADGPCTDAAD